MALRKSTDGESTVEWKSIQASRIRRPAMIFSSVCGDSYWRLSTSNFDEASFAFRAADDKSDKMDAMVYVNDSLMSNNAPILMLREALNPD